MVYLPKFAKKIARKARNKLFGAPRLVWTVDAVSDASGPTDNVRNYLERKHLRAVLSELTAKHQIKSAAEVGCGYGRMIMVLNEFAGHVVGYEREKHLIAIAQGLLPEIEFQNCSSLDQISELRDEKYDFIMTWTVLQHMTDDFAQKVLGEIKKMAPRGYVLISEKTEPINITKNFTDGNQFISRARSVDVYKEWMAPYVLVRTLNVVLEKSYNNPKPGTCMLFKSPSIG